MGTKGSFDCWKHKNEDGTQRHLFAVLKAIDTVAVCNASYVNIARAAADAADAADDDADDDTDGAIAVCAVARVAARAADAARVADVARVADTNCNVARVANRVAARAVARAAVDACDAAMPVIDLQPILLKDLEIIKNKKCNFQSNITLYGGIWADFQRVLNDLGCEYWGKWYAKVFDNNFMLDDPDFDDIELRLNVPGEIMAHGAATVARYVIKLKTQGAVRLNEARVIILGDKGSGKTSLARRLKNPFYPMPTEDDSTDGVDLIDWIVPNDLNQPDNGVNVHIWDFAGHAITHSVHRCFMSERCLYILVVDGRTEGGNRAEYWLDQIQHYSRDSPVLIFVNIRDKHPADIPEDVLRDEFSSIKKFYQVNIDKDDTLLEAFRQDVMNLLRNNPLWKNQKISIPAYNVKETLRKKFVEDKMNFIDQKTFSNIAKNSGLLENEHEQLLKDLSDLGVCLWYDNNKIIQAEGLLLNPNWVSYGIYRLINWGIEQKKYRFSSSDLSQVFTGTDADKYPKEKADVLLTLMTTNKLAFFKDSHTKEILVPLLLPAGRRKDVPPPDFPLGGCLRIEYRTSRTLPPHIVVQLALSHPEELIEQSSWRFGAVLQWKQDAKDKNQLQEAILAEALVEENERMRSVTVSVKGPKRTEYIDKLRTTLNNIFADYKNSCLELKYEILFNAGNDTSSITREALLRSEYNLKFTAGTGQKLVTRFKGKLRRINPRPTMEAYSLKADPKETRNSFWRSVAVVIVGSAIISIGTAIVLIMLVKFGILEIDSKEIIYRSVRFLLSYLR
jgi:GTPase SAR1 family protein